MQNFEKDFLQGQSRKGSRKVEGGWGWGYSFFKPHCIMVSFSALCPWWGGWYHYRKSPHFRPLTEQAAITNLHPRSRDDLGLPSEIMEDSKNKNTHTSWTRAFITRMSDHIKWYRINSAKVGSGCNTLDTDSNMSSRLPPRSRCCSHLKWGRGVLNQDL